ncbi:MAG: prepilin peptidase [Methylophilus sp.]|uniref:prepilin peptidase n=1 Tax=Methylophilus sp. TaxID=29541 RepID=UPI003F9F20F3
MTIAEMVVVAWCLCVILTDMHARRIPNSLSLGMCLIALCWLLITSHSMLNATVQSAALGAAISLLLTLPAYAARLLGAGDVKLLLAIALVSGGYFTLFAFVIAAFLAVTLGAVCFLVTRLRARPLTRRKWLPFGAALSVGLLMAIGITK